MSRPVQQPDKRLRNALVAWIPIIEQARELVKSQLDQFRDMLSNPNLGFADRLAIVSSIRDLVTTSVKTVESGLKAVEEPVEDSPEDLLEELQGGRG